MRLSEAGFFLDGRILYRAQIYVNSTWILHCTSELHDALDKKILDLLAKKNDLLMKTNRALCVGLVKKFASGSRLMYSRPPIGYKIGGTIS